MRNIDNGFVVVLIASLAGEEAILVELFTTQRRSTYQRVGTLEERPDRHCAGECIVVKTGRAERELISAQEG